MKLWGGRFESGPSEVFQRYSWSLHFDSRLFRVDVLGSIAYARALTRVGILNDEECSTLCEALASIPEPPPDAPDEDIHTYVIRMLKEKAGVVADKMHTGRSRNEQVSLDVRFWLREELDRTRGLLRALMSDLLGFAAKHVDTVVAGYTHMRRAQPVTWAHYLLAYFEAFARDHERFSQARARVNRMPLGSGALAGSGFPIDREELAAELGFQGVTNNSMDVSADRDFLIDYLSSASTCMLHLSRLAEDWILYSSDEFGWLQLGDGVTSGSSLMPQKKNPDSLELIRGKCGRVFASYTSLMMTMKGLPMTYNRDMQEDKEPLFDAVDQLTLSLEMAAVVVQTTKLNPEPALQAAEEGWLVATDLAEALSRSGLPFHQAHQLVGSLVLESVRANKKPSEWTAEALTAFDQRFKPEMAALMNPAEGMKTRTSKGGTAPSTVRTALAEARQRLESMSS
ncbi:argininosuccinate lyase [Paludibaculum fermentans]|uniref:Argininosuccinate lyase n=1 Tax=Paludibaculum fermentans TaxID=1473598 RepID=A0A7S7SLZ1_PALFE|nr:argininosuccinate lyase [Paludibaculum fermentans]QOY89348.1 argininosuccinate lyase [Paludibaculum fermentans]